MAQFMTKKEALKEFRELYLAGEYAIPRGDLPMKREAWNNYTDSLRTERRISKHQYSTWDNPF